MCLQIKQESLQVFLLFETFTFFLRFLSEERKTHYACNFSKIKENFSFMSLEESLKNLGRKVMAKHRIHTTELYELSLKAEVSDPSVQL